MIANPSHKLWIASAIVGLVGLVDAGYLTWIKLSHQEAACIKGIGDCFTVNTSQYSTIAGIPVALLGLIAYLAILLVLFLEARGGLFWEENGVLLVFGLSLFGTLFSAYLTYLELAVIKAICPFCVVSAIAMVLLLVFSIARFARSQLILNS